MCFANPGTSELHFVAALDHVGGMRCVLGLFEGVLTGAADGYARMADRPASTLLHLGPGLANGLSNLHNAMRAQSPVVNIIGDHATYHRHYDAPLTSDIEGTARPFSHWVRTSPNADSLAADAAAAVAAARTAPGRVASLILPADASWGAAHHRALPRRGGRARSPAGRPRRRSTRPRDILRSGGTAALILGPKATGSCPSSGPGRSPPSPGRACTRRRTPHASPAARGACRCSGSPIRSTRRPRPSTACRTSSWWARSRRSPSSPIRTSPASCHRPGTRVHELARDDQDVPGALTALCDALDAGGATPERAGLQPAGPPHRRR